jgi:hypothetical protein
MIPKGLLSGDQPTPITEKERLSRASFAGDAIMAVGNTVAERYMLRERTRMREHQLQHQMRIANIQARDVEIRGQRAIEATQRQIAATLGAQRATLAAQGVDVGQGSALELQEETAALGAEALETLSANIFREAWGIKAQAAGMESQAEFVRVGGRGMERESVVTAGANIVRAGQRFAIRRAGG